ncbi:uncharacterized protein UV8b_06276 [Ustilaginoidea virens]|uniref:Uncharacterized protein n=1 Tax=Ustilaginoidea virens TaxID=1159556 RepID=A0A8E5HV99_USTVR|nr:uncharacterized protein UV8b_06276 [Ustilaginoidea virens]QUC22035.1 hypothetical protein UV8b_06276 [Ustilaginoidea virens]
MWPGACSSESPYPTKLVDKKMRDQMREQHEPGSADSFVKVFSDVRHPDGAISTKDMSLTGLLSNFMLLF